MRLELFRFFGYSLLSNIIAALVHHNRICTRSSIKAKAPQLQSIFGSKNFQRMNFQAFSVLPNGIDDSNPTEPDEETLYILRTKPDGKCVKVCFGTALGKSFFDIMSPVVRTGNISADFAANIDICLDKEKAGERNNIILGTLMKPNIENMLSLAKPSPFGRKEETVYDDTIRKGFELAADQFTITDENIILDAIAKEVKKYFFPYLAGDSSILSFNRYKMVFYQEGGHFQFHRDTLHADNHQATLLLEVRSAHEGGKIVIAPVRSSEKNIDDSLLTSIDFNKEGSSIAPLNWIVFYTDILHKIEPVTSGTRIAIQYDIYVNPSGSSTVQYPKGHNKYKDYYQMRKDEVIHMHQRKEKFDEVEDVDIDHEKFSVYDYDVYDYDDYDDNCAFRAKQEHRVFLESSQHIAEHSIVYQALDSKIDAFIALLDKEFSEMNSDRIENIVLPLFHRYCAASIRPDLLKATDHLLFQALARTNNYFLGLSPMFIYSQSNMEGMWNMKDYDANLLDSMTTMYQWNATTGVIEAENIRTEHVLNSRDCIYMVSNREDSILLEFTEYDRWTGNEAQSGWLQYFLGVMVISRKE